VFGDGRGVTNTTDPNGVVNKQSTQQTIDVLDIRNFTTTYPDNFVLVSDVSNPMTAGANAILARVTAITAGSPAPLGTITLAGLTTQAANVFPGGLGSFPRGSLILTATAVTYRIDTAYPNIPEPVLVMVRGGPLGIAGYSDPLATQIEDLQVALGYDGLNNILPLDNFITAADRIRTEDTTGVNLDEWAFNVPGETLPGAINMLRALRVSLVARSVNPRNIGFDALSVEDHAPSATGTKYLRRRLTGVASVRNLAL
jgi:hypothetical protein